MLDAYNISKSMKRGPRHGTAPTDNTSINGNGSKRNEKGKKKKRKKRLKMILPTLPRKKNVIPRDACDSFFMILPSQPYPVQIWPGEPDYLPRLQ